MQSALEDAQIKKNALGAVLREIEMKLEGLSVDKETYAAIEAIELQKKAYQKLLLVRKVEAQQVEAQGLRQRRADLLGQRELLLHRREEKLADNSEQLGLVEDLRLQITQTES